MTGVDVSTGLEGLVGGKVVALDGEQGQGLHGGDLRLGEDPLLPLGHILVRLNLHDGRTRVGEDADLIRAFPSRAATRMTICSVDKLGACRVSALRTEKYSILKPSALSAARLSASCRAMSSREFSPAFKSSATRTSS